MKTVDILTQDMHSVHGANRVTEALIKGREIFEKNQLHLRYVVSQDGIIDCWKYNTSSLGKNLNLKTYKRKRFIIEILKKLFIYKTYFSQKYIVSKYIKNNKKVVDYYFKRIPSNGIIIDKRADIIIFQDPFTAQFYLKETEDFGKSIFISHAESDPLQQLLLNRPAIKNTNYEKKLRNEFTFVINHVDAVITICQTAQKYNKKYFSKDCPCIINGIEDVELKKVDKYSFSDGKIHIAILASVQYRKGQDLAIDALLRLPISERKKIVLDIMGSGPSLKELKEKVEAKELDDNVVFYGNVLDVADKLLFVDAFLLPSRADTVPISILEGMRANLPIFATAVGEIPEMIADCGMLIEPTVDSIEQLYKEIILGKYDFYELGNKSRKKFLKEYNLSVMIQKYADILNEI